MEPERKEEKMEGKWLYEVMYNNMLLPRRRENQITYEEFMKLPEAEIQRIIDKSKDLEISKERFFQHMDI